VIQQRILKRIVSDKLEMIRQQIVSGDAVADEGEVVESVIDHIRKVSSPSLKPVINATGIILHTNLGRAPFGQEILSEIKPIFEGYNNLEFDLQTARRGNRNGHLSELLRLVLNCEDSVVVNNNAAALFLVLKQLAEKKEIIVSRGELVEIGGSFRIPEIVESSGAKLVEVGTTNKTKIEDYERAITEDTAAILKVHKSNYYIQGFTAEVSLTDLSLLSKQHNLSLVYDLGTGLIDNTLYKGLSAEPDIKTSFEQGADIVVFSCDKILGGPQAGIISGKQEIIRKVSQHPLMRILRVDKMTISVLNAVLIEMMYKREHIEQKIPVVRYINRSPNVINKLALKLAKRLDTTAITSTIIDSKGQCGGGTLPYHHIESKAVLVEPKEGSVFFSKEFAEKIYYRLLTLEKPILGILREGKLFFDVLTLEEKDIEHIGCSLEMFLGNECR